MKKRLHSMGMALLLLATAGRADDTFLAACAERAEGAQQSGQMAVQGEDGWMFLASELRHVGAGPFWGPTATTVSRATKPDYADPVPAIVDFHNQLKDAGIDLWLVPVPPKVAVYADKLTEGAPPGRIDEHHQTFYALLRGQGITIVDLLPDFLNARGASDQDLYCRQDSHWAGAAIEIAADVLAAEIGKQPWSDGLPAEVSAREHRSITIAGDLWDSLEDDSLERETLELSFVRDEAGEPLAPDRDSPVLLMGDSHTLVFHAGGDMHTVGAGLIDNLANRLQSRLDLIGVRGSGATPARINLMRKSRADKSYLANKKLVIWCFGAREFTESDGWRKVPLGL